MTDTPKFRPLLAASIDSDEQLSTLQYPMIASPKVDGIRVLIHPQLGPVTRSLKPVRNDYVRKRLEAAPETVGLDGEVVVGEIASSDVFNRTTAIMAQHEEPDFTYWVFDHFLHWEQSYSYRLGYTKAVVREVQEWSVKLLPSVMVDTPDEILEAEVWWLAQGFEGIMLRNPLSKYKFNRSTLKEQILLKLKRFKDDEATIVGFEPLERNLNEAKTNALGFTERSDHQAGRIADSTLGNLLVHHPRFGAFSIGSGFDASLRQHVWNDQSRYLGKRVKFKYQATGIVEKPRFPIFLGFRPEE